MTNFLRRGRAYAFLMASVALVGLSPSAHAQAVDTTTPAADATADTNTADQAGDIVVIGSGETRSVSTLLPSNLGVLPPGTSVQKALNFLPGVMAQSIDALGVNEQSLSLQVRGFSTTHLGYTLDGMPLGDGAYNNYNGLTISRALISDNLGHADLATGIAGLGIPSTSNLGGAVTYVSSDPHRDLGLAVSQTVGSDDGLRTFVRFDTGEHGGFSAYFSGQYSQQDLFVNQGAWNKSTGKQFNGKVQYRFDGGKITAFADLSRTNQADDPYLSKDMLARLGYDWGGYAPDWQTYLSRAYLLGDRADGADQVRRRAGAAKECRRHLHQRPDPAQRRPLLSRRGFRPHQEPQRPHAGLPPHRQGAPATTGSPAGPRRAPHPPPTTCRSRSATRATPSIAPAWSEA
ncbi:MAG: TonB-dependent receptor plug domain-containing protein [Sphingomonas sp.]